MKRREHHYDYHTEQQWFFWHIQIVSRLILGEINRDALIFRKSGLPIPTFFFTTTTNSIHSYFCNLFYFSIVISPCSFN